MNNVNNNANEPRNVVDEVRAARAAVSKEAGGFAGLGDYLRRVQAEFEARTGRFAGVPSERPDEVRRIVNEADSVNQMLDDHCPERSRSAE